MIRLLYNFLVNKNASLFVFFSFGLCGGKVVKSSSPGGLPTCKAQSCSSVTYPWIVIQDALQVHTATHGFWSVSAPLCDKTRPDCVEWDFAWSCWWTGLLAHSQFHGYTHSFPQRNQANWAYTDITP